MTTAGKSVDTNSFGMRDDERQFEKTPGTFRILLLGDSFMEAMQVNWEDSLASKLSSQLAESGARNVEIINASVSGWGTDDQLTYYLRYGHKFSPDLILLGMTLHNDVADNVQLEFHSYDKDGLVERPQTTLSASVYARTQIQEWLASHSHLYRLVVGRLRSASVRQGGKELNRHVQELMRRPSSPQIDAGWSFTLALLDKMHERGKQNGSELAVFLIPLAMQVTDWRLEQLLEAFQLEQSALALTRPQEVMLDWGSDRGVPVLDLLPRFRSWAATNEIDPYLVEDGHWNEQGHALGARIVARGLTDSNLVPQMNNLNPP
jgi:hypothetical protein